MQSKNHCNLVKSWTRPLILVCLFLINYSFALAANDNFSIKTRPTTFRKISYLIEEQSDYTFAFKDADIEQLKVEAVNYTGDKINALLDLCLKSSGIEYEIIDKTIVLRRKLIPTAAMQTSQDKVVKGTVVDAKGTPLPGVAVIVKGTSYGVTTNENGIFSITLPNKEKVSLVFSFIGMKSFNLEITDLKPIKVVLQDDVYEMEEAVITGIYERKKESFTGSTQTFKGSELKQIGTQNVLQSLKTLDPSFVILENNQFGSDPNRTPNLEIRGKTSIVGLKEEFGEDPNQPLFILDGFETTLQTVMDLSIDRIASITILKDAASTAIYGSKAANGVLVIETKSPKTGKFSVSYNGSFNVNFADLSDYNLMNAQEKLEFELLSGNFKSNIPSVEEDNRIRYNKLLSNVKRGVNTYWLTEPLRTGFTQRHSLYLEGGDSQMRYGIGMNYSDIQGVMEASSREIFSGNLDMLYRKNKISFSNKLTVDYTKTNDPLVAFSEYSRANPYYEKRIDGAIQKWLESPDPLVGTNNDAAIWVANPLWNDNLNSYKNGSKINIRNNLNIEYRPLSSLFVRARLGISKTVNNNEEFTSPEHSRYDEVDILKKGDYEYSQGEEFSYDADATITYGNIFLGVHRVNGVLGAQVSESSLEYRGFEANGFPEGGFATPGFANQYPDAGKPSYRESKRRNANFYFNGGYSYDDKYLLDVNLRADGTSVFGVNHRFSTTWAVGGAWNLHKEPFIRRIHEFNMLKVRYSIGNPGNQNFGAYNAITTYQFNNWLINNFGPGVIVSAFGDPDLAWQKTIDQNVGLDFSSNSNRFHLTLDYYVKSTDPLMASIGIPSSIGLTTRLTNVGKQVEKGITGTIKYSFLYQPNERKTWTTSLSFRHGKAHYTKIGNKLKDMNKENMSSSLLRYYDGGSPTALWAVRSQGIDPATGREIFLTKDGRRTFTHSYDNEVEIGDTRPTLEGVFGNSLYWKGFSVSCYFRYSFGADVFNTTLYEKVENISSYDLQKNQDKRALYDRWKNPGDKAKFKGISLTEQTPMSSRFVQKNNYIALESVRVGYELNNQFCKSLGISGASISAYMNDICRWSTLEDERGIDYPFARSCSFALSVNF